MYDLAKRSSTAALTLDKPLNGSNLQLRAVYKQAGDVFILEESWKFDANNRMTGAYNFSTEEAQFGYTYTRDDWSATGRYNLKSDVPSLEVAKRAGKATVTALYAPRDEALTLTWAAKPLRATLKGKVGRGGVGATSASLMVTHEFDL